MKTTLTCPGCGKVIKEKIEGKDCKCGQALSCAVKLTSKQREIVKKMYERTLAAQKRALTMTVEEHEQEIKELFY